MRPAATAVAVGRGTIAAVGTDREVLRLRGPHSRVIDLRGRALLPGLSDAHIHLVYYGLVPSWLDLAASPNMEALLAQVRQGVSPLPAGSWVYGRGWDPERLAEGRGPTRAELDAAAPHHPVLLSRRDGHLCVANSVALREAGIGRDTPSPVGGEILRDEGGEATGGLAEAAIYLAWNRMMDWLPVHAFEEAILRAGGEAARHGLTSAHCILLESVPREVEAFSNLEAAGRLPLGCYLVPSVESLPLLATQGLLGRGGEGRVRLGGAKIFADGTVFGHTAALRQPYADRPETAGALNYPPEVLRQLVAQVRAAGLQPVVHASGDRAVEACLDAFEAVLGAEASRWRPRLEHVTVLEPDLLGRMARMGAVASVQPRRGDLLERRLGPERVDRAATLRPLLEGGVVTAGGSDAPFVQASLAPLTGVQAMVLQNGLTVEEAWGLFSRGAAFASFAEERTGLLRPGFLADLVVLEEDPRLMPPDQIASVPILMTVSGGQVTWEAPGVFS